VGVEEVEVQEQAMSGLLRAVEASEAALLALVNDNCPPTTALISITCAACRLSWKRLSLSCRPSEVGRQPST
jgi:hypothetical protein